MRERVMKGKIDLANDYQNRQFHRLYDLGRNSLRRVFFEIIEIFTVINQLIGLKADRAGPKIEFLSIFIRNTI